MTSAYLRARDADPKSSYGDFAAVSHPVDDDLAGLLSGIVCHGIIAPGYDPGTVGKLSKKKNGRFLIVEADPAFTPPPRETRERAAPVTSKPPAANTASPSSAPARGCSTTKLARGHARRHATLTACSATPRSARS